MNARPMYTVTVDILHPPAYPQQCECKRRATRRYSIAAKGFDDAAAQARKAVDGEVEDCEITISKIEFGYFYEANI